MAITRKGTMMAEKAAEILTKLLMAIIALLLSILMAFSVTRAEKAITIAHKNETALAVHDARDEQVAKSLDGILQSQKEMKDILVNHMIEAKGNPND